MNFNTPKVNNVYKGGMGAAKSGGGQAILLVIVIGLFSWYIVVPKYNAYGETKKKLIQAQEELTQVQNAQATITSLTAQLDESKNAETLKLLDEAIPLESRSSRIYILMESLVQGAGLTMGSMNIEPIASLASDGTNKKSDAFDQQRGLTTYTMSLNMAGTMQRFLNFLQVLENNPRLFDITTLDIGGEQEDNLSFKVTVKAYAFATDTKSVETAGVPVGGPAGSAVAAPSNINIPPAPAKP